MSLIERVQQLGIILRPRSSTRNTVITPSGVVGTRYKAGKVSDRQIEIYNGTSEAHPRLGFYAGGFQFGSGSASTDTSIGRRAPLGSNTAGLLEGSRGPSDTSLYDQSGELNVRHYGARGDGSTDDRAAIQAAIDAAAALSQPATVFFPPGIYLVNCTSAGLSIPNSKAIRLLGSSMHLGATIGGSQIHRSAGTNTLISNVDGGEGVGTSLWLENLLIYGGTLDGRVLHILRGTNTNFHQCWFGAGTGTKTVPGVDLQRMWNCHITKCYFTGLGTGSSVPAVLMTDVSGESGSSTNTVHVTDCEFENNRGTDLILDSSATGSNRCTAVTLLGCKFEENVPNSTRNWPLLRLALCQGTLVNACTFWLPDGYALIEQTHNSATGNTIVGSSLTGSILTDQSGAQYFIDQQDGELMVVGCRIANSAANLTSAWHIGSGVDPGDAIEGGIGGGTNIYFDETPSKRYVDDRTIKTGPTRVVDFQTAKVPVRVASVANVNTASPGATIDGVTMAAGDRVLLKDQTTENQNGIWVWNGSAVAMTRAADADEGIELRAGVQVAVEDGTKNKDTGWLNVINGIPTLGTTSIRWSRTQPAYARGADQDPWATGSAISETFQREHATTAVALTDVRMFFAGGCVIPANRTVTNISVYCIVVGTAYVDWWWAIVRQSDRSVLQRTANSTTLMTINAVNTRALQATYTAPVDVPVYVVIGFDGGTVPQLAGTAAGQANLLNTAPILAAESNVDPTSTPPTVGSTLAAPGVTRTQNIYAYLT